MLKNKELEKKDEPRVGTGLMNALVGRTGVDKVFNHFRCFCQVRNTAIAGGIQHRLDLTVP